MLTSQNELSYPSALGWHSGHVSVGGVERLVMSREELEGTMILEEAQRSIDEWRIQEEEDTLM